MKKRFENLDFGNRLKYLMNSKGIFTAGQLAIKLYESDIMKYPEGCTDKKERQNYTKDTINRHLKYESGSKLSGEWMRRYCDFFGCSADYLLGYIDLPTHSYTDIHLLTGLSQETIEKLIYYKTHLGWCIKPLNIILQSTNFANAVSHISEYVNKVKIFDIIAGQKFNSGYTYNENMEKNYREKQQEMMLEEYIVDQNLRFLIQEIKRLAKEEVKQSNNKKT